jgi:hypothetical protein
LTPVEREEAEQLLRETLAFVKAIRDLLKRENYDV